MQGLSIGDYKGLSVSGYKGKLDGILRVNWKIFESKTPLVFKRPERILKGGRADFFVPGSIAEGKWLFLIGRKGAIRARETWILGSRSKIQERVAYSYELQVNGWLYSCCSDNPGSSSRREKNYNFRYEQDERKVGFTHPTHHLHVIHSEPRYCAKEKMTFKYFLEYVKANFFDDLEAWRLEPIWLR